MKKLLISFFALTLSFCGFTQTQSFCNDSVPGWGKSLGTITFHTDRVWTISNDTIAQIWSDAVTATACQKESFDGGYRDSTTGHHWGEHNYSADCRSNPNFPGDLFSWCAVVRFADQLCPYPWRVPDSADFNNLDIALGGDGNFRYQITTDHHTLETQLGWYIETWGGAFSGRCNPDGSLYNQGFGVSYWSQSEHSANRGFSLGLTIERTFAQSFAGKHYGFPLRCVRYK